MIDYMQSEFLSRFLAAAGVLTRTSVLERMCGPLFETALEMGGAGVPLAELARSNLLLVPLDRRGELNRYHHRSGHAPAELERCEPGLIAVRRRRAAGLCLGNGMPEEARSTAWQPGTSRGRRRWGS